MKILFLLATALWFAGCATNFEAPPLQPSHPANPQAVEARAERPPRLAADALTRKTKTLLTQHDAPEPDYQPVNGSASVYWTCPMHPDVHAGAPGQCPKCGMTLVKKEGAPE